MATADTRRMTRRLLVLPLLAGLLFLPGCFWWLAPMAAVGSEQSESGSSTVSGPAAAEEGMADVRAAIPAIEAYYADNGTYKGATLQVLQQRYDAGLRGVEIVKANDQTYCVQSTNDGFPWYKAGPAAEILPGDCSMPPLEQLPPPQTDADMCIQLEMNGEPYYQVGPNGRPTPGLCP
jgi:hypothetical protein